jgi:hypothetical protein
MSLHVDEIEVILRQHWKIPSGLAPRELHDLAFTIQVMVGQKYSRDNLKYQLGLIQTTRLKQKLDDQACDRIATDLLRSANT